MLNVHVAQSWPKLMKYTLIMLKLCYEEVFVSLFNPLSLTEDNASGDRHDSTRDRHAFEQLYRGRMRIFKGKV